MLNVVRVHLSLLFDGIPLPCPFEARWSHSDPDSPRSFRVVSCRPRRRRRLLHLWVRSSDEDLGPGCYGCVPAWYAARRHVGNGWNAFLHPPRFTDGLELPSSTYARNQIRETHQGNENNIVILFNEDLPAWAERAQQEQNQAPAMDQHTTLLSRTCRVRDTGAV